MENQRESDPKAQASSKSQIEISPISIWFYDYVRQQAE